MDNGIKDHDSEMSFGTSSGSSQTSATNIDAETVRLGSDKLSTIFLRQYGIALVTIILPQLSRLIEISLIVRFLGFQILNQLAILLPISDILNKVFLCSCSQATNVFVQRNISKNQIIAANIYVAHYFIIAAIWVVICLIIYFALLASFFNDQTIGFYLLLKGAICPLLCVFSESLDCFFRSENRTWTIFIKSIVFFGIDVSLTVVFFVMSDSIGLTLSNPAIAFTIAQGIVMFWCLIMIFRIPFLDIQYRGIVKFQFKKLSPIRPKILLQILSFTFPQLFVQFSQQLIYLEAALMTKLMVIQEDYQLIQYAQIIVFFELSNIYYCFLQAAKEALGQIVSYNMGIKKITRIYEAIKYCLIITLSINIVLFAIEIFISRFFVKLLLPQFSPNEFYDNNINAALDAATASAWSQLLNILYPVSQCLLHLESRIGISIVISLIPLLFNCIYIPLSLISNFDNSPIVTYIALSFISNFILGFGFYIYFYLKYRQLFKINLQKKDIAASDNTNAITSEIRESVMYQLQAAIEIEDPKKQRQSVANLFDKTHMLRNSTSFAQMRVSMSSVALNSELRRSTINDYKTSFQSSTLAQELQRELDED